MEDASRRRPFRTTGHTDPYHGGSIGLSLSRKIEAGEAEANPRCCDWSTSSSMDYAPGRIRDTINRLVTLIETRSPD